MHLIHAGWHSIGASKLEVSDVLNYTVVCFEGCANLELEIALMMSLLSGANIGPDKSTEGHVGEISSLVKSDSRQGTTLSRSVLCTVPTIASSVLHDTCIYVRGIFRQRHNLSPAWKSGR